jgi:hypothetical protein
MWEWEEGGVEVRFLPVAWLPREVLEELDRALCQLVEGVRARARAGREAAELSEGIARARGELARHAGPPGEPCLLTKEAILDLSAEMSAASRSLREAGLFAAAFVASGVEACLVERILDAQPMAPA